MLQSEKTTNMESPDHPLVKGTLHADAMYFL